MPDFHESASPIWLHDEALTTLECETFADTGCTEHGIIMYSGARSWGRVKKDSVMLQMAHEQIPMLSYLAHDERGGPYLIRDDGSERTSVLLSLTDEDDTLAGIWAHAPKTSRVRGLGIDLTDSSRFRNRPKERRDLAELLLTDGERSLAPLLVELGARDLSMAHAMLFAAKEAAFKSLAAPLRAWYREHDEKLLFEVRHFVMQEPGIERGTGRGGAAQRAMEKMGASHISVHMAEVGDMAVVAAVAS